MTTNTDGDPERQHAHPPPAIAALADGHDEPWGYECALPFLQVMAESAELGTHGWPCPAVR